MGGREPMIVYSVRHIFIHTADFNYSYKVDTPIGV